VVVLDYFEVPPEEEWLELDEEEDGDELEEELASLCAFFSLGKSLSFYLTSIF
jgi:hypothetical protein